MTEKANPSKNRPAEAFKTAGAIAYGGQGDSGFIINDNNPTEISKEDAQIDETNFNSFSLGDDYSSNSFDVIIDGGEAFIFGAWIAKDTPITVTLQSNTDNQIVYLGWDKDSPNDVIIGLQSAFSNSSGNTDKKIPLYIFDTDSTGVTNVSDSRPIVQDSFPGEILSDGTNQFESSDGTVAFEISPDGAVNIQSLELSGNPIDTDNNGVLDNSSVTGLKTFSESSSFSGYPLNPSTDLADDSITINSADGLSGGGSVSLGDSTSFSVDASDIAGSGLEADFNNNLDLVDDSISINSANGLSGGGSISLGGSTSLSINSSELAGSGLGTDSNDNLTLSENSLTISSGKGISGGGTISLGGATQLTIDPSDFAGTGLNDGNNNNLNLANNSITINSGTGLSGGSTITLGGTLDLSVDITDLESEFAPNRHGNNSHTDNYTTLTLDTVKENIHNIPGTGNGIDYNSDTNKYSVNVSEVTDTPSAGTALKYNSTNNEYNVQAGNFADATHTNDAHENNYTTLTLNEVKDNIHNKPSPGTALGFNSSTNTYNVKAENFADANHGDNAHDKNYLTSVPSAGTSLTLTNDTYDVQAEDFADATHGNNSHFNDYLTSPPSAGAALTLTNDTYDVDTEQFASDNHNNNAHSTNYIDSLSGGNGILPLNISNGNTLSVDWADAENLSTDGYVLWSNAFDLGTSGKIEQLSGGVVGPDGGVVTNIQGDNLDIDNNNNLNATVGIENLSGGDGINPSNIDDGNTLTVDWADAENLSADGYVLWGNAFDLGTSGTIEQLSGGVVGPDGGLITNIQGDNLNIDDNNNLNATVGIETLSGGDGISPANIGNTDTISVDWEDAGGLYSTGYVNWGRGDDLSDNAEINQLSGNIVPGTGGLITNIEGDNLNVDDNYNLNATVGIKSLDAGEGIFPTTIKDGNTISVVWDSAFDLDTLGAIEELSGAIVGSNNAVSNIAGNNLNVDGDGNLNATTSVTGAVLEDGSNWGPTNLFYDSKNDTVGLKSEISGMDEVRGLNGLVLRADNLTVKNQQGETTANIDSNGNLNLAGTVNQNAF